MTSADKFLGLAMPWYRADDYAELLQLFTDGASLPPTFEAWLADNEKTLQQAHDRGQKIHCVEIRAVAFAHWCQARNIPPDERGRLWFIRDHLEALDKKRH